MGKDMSRVFLGRLKGYCVAGQWRSNRDGKTEVSALKGMRKKGS